MKCPNCGEDLVEINGRYICSDCGKEVPESEMNVGTWGEGATKAEDPEPGEEPVNDYSAVNDNEDYIADSAGQPIPDEPVASEPEASENTIPKPESNETEIPETEQNISSTEVGAVPVVEPEPVSEPAPEPIEGPPAPVDSSPADTSPSEGAGPEAAADSVTPANASVETPSVEVPDPLVGNNEPNAPDGSIPTAQDFYQPETQTEPEPNEAEPVETPAETLAQPATPLPPDPNIYRDPLYDQPNDPALPAQADADVVTPGPVAKSNNSTLLIIAGIVLVLLLLGGGAAAYVLLGKKSTVVETPAPVPVSTTVNCDNKSTDADKKACIENNFANCSPAMYSSTIDTSTNSYEVRGLQNGACLVNVVALKNGDAAKEGKIMECLFDNTLKFDEAVAKSSADICTGDLATLLFPKASN